MLHNILIDDEPQLRHALERLVKQYCPDAKRQLQPNAKYKSLATIITRERVEALNQRSKKKSLSRSLT